MVELKPVKSEMIAAAGYDCDHRILYVLFNTGDAYEYYDVSEGTYWSLISAESKGHFMQERVIDQFPYHRFSGWRAPDPSGEQSSNPPCSSIPPPSS